MFFELRQYRTKPGQRGKWVKFMEEEIKKTRGAIVTILFAVVMAVVSIALTMAGEPGLGALLGFIGLALLRFVYQFSNVEFDIFEKKDWIGNGFIYFFTWLGIWILLCNPPFNDLAHPTIRDIEVWGEDAGELTLLNESNAYYLINQGENVTLSARVTDNVEVSSVSISVEDYSGAPTETHPTEHTYSWLLQNVTLGNYTFTIHAEDVNGNSHSRSWEFTVV